jgi:5-(carboxyamino)imidazole ribonucleotide mutase
MIASFTSVPVTGLTLKGGSLRGLDSLVPMLQMRNGVPVATMGIDSSYNAGLIACEILATKYPHLQKKLVSFTKSRLSTRYYNKALK